MPFDAPVAATMPVDAAEYHGVPRHILARHALEQLGPALREAVIAIELSEAAGFVNLGMNFDRVAWRAVWKRPGLPDVSGTIAVWNGEIAT